MLTVTHLDFGYANTPILSIPKLELPEHQHLMVAGNSGSGKTSLLFLLAGLLTPREGSITLDKTNITAFRGHARDKFRGRHIGFVFQSPHLMSALTVMQNLHVSAFMAGQKADLTWIKHLLEKLGIADLAKRYPSELSLGQQQRAGMARALVNRPRLVLADEPTSALDDDACEAVITLLLETARESKAHVVVATHDARIKPHFKNVLNLKSQKAV